MPEATDAAALFAQAGIAPDLCDRLSFYADRLLAANRQTNLTGARSPAHLVAHVLDSLTLLPYVTGRLVDVGSGGGLPAIPLALASGLEVTLIEATGKKAAFLTAVCADLGLAARVVAGRAEDAAHWPDLRERFDTATARAVSGAATVAELTLPFLRVGGMAVLQRGAAAPGEREGLAGVALCLGGEIESETDLGSGRRVLILRKSIPTATRFPRRAGIPEKRPLYGVPRGTSRRP